MSLESKVVKFAEEVRAYLIAAIANQKNQKDTKTVKWQGFDEDGNATIDNEGKIQKVNAIGSVSQQKNKKLIVDSTGSVEYFKRPSKPPELQALRNDNQVISKKKVLVKKNRASDDIAESFTKNLEPPPEQAAPGEPIPNQLNLVCIAVIDENDGLATDTEWAEFRTAFPSREFYLLQPHSPPFPPGDLYVPAAFANDNLASRIFVSREPNFEDWFATTQLFTKPRRTQVILFVDQSGSMTIESVRSSYDFFVTQCDNAGLYVTTVTDSNENYIAPFYIGQDYYYGSFENEWYE